MPSHPAPGVGVVLECRSGSGWGGQYYPPLFCIFVFLYFGVKNTMAKDVAQSRKWMVTINNPEEHGYSHEKIIDIMSDVRGKSLYWCMCDEAGDECETRHTHIFIYRNSPFTYLQIDALFPKMHRDNCYGSCPENRAYILKDGPKFNKDPETGAYHYTDKKGKLHVGTNFSDTFYESGTCPVDGGSSTSAADTIVDMIRDGRPDDEIIDMVPSAYRCIEDIQRTRAVYRDQDFTNKWRDLQVTYIFGKTGSGKTRSVMEKYGYASCYRVTDYKHPFDNYDGQDVLIFEEFRGSLKHGDMLVYLDGYPVRLPCRYFNRTACFTKVYIISNIPPNQQYPNIDTESRDAFYRRIHKVLEYGPFGQINEYSSVKAYVNRHNWVQ